jgi:hypothetical protein
MPRGIPSRSEEGFYALLNHQSRHAIIIRHYRPHTPSEGPASQQEILSFFVYPGSYALERSTDLQHWDLDQRFVTFNGFFALLQDPLTPPNMFYRLRQE